MTDLKQEMSDDQPWNAAQYEVALANLERLQEQLDNLRASLPSIVAPLSRPNISRPQLFAEIKKAAVGATSDAQAFRDNWTSEQTQSTFTKTKESLQKDSDLTKAENVPRYGWTAEK